MNEREREEQPNKVFNNRLRESGRRFKTVNQLQEKHASHSVHLRK